MRNMGTVIGLLGTLAACGSGLAWATERHVPAQYPTIKAAVYACVNGDIVTVAPGVYTGAGNKNIDCSNKGITIRSAGGPATCIIDCEQEGPAFSVLTSYTPPMVLQGFTIQNGHASAGAGVGCRIGYSSSITIADCYFVNNVAPKLGDTPGRGGGLYVSEGSVRLKNCRFLGNEADEGAGIYCSRGAGVNLCNCRFVGNSATLMGGAIYGSCSLVNCLMADNTAEFYGGAILVEGSSILARTTTIVGNTAGWYGGGVYLYGDAYGWVYNSIAALNSAPYGSQLAVEGSSSVDVWYSDFYGVQPIYVAGASYVEWGSGNINADPLFVDAPNGDYHLLSGSPCADAGDNTHIDYDCFDLDGDGDTAEQLPYDLENGCRVDDDPNAPGEWLVDMGAYEWTPYPVGDVNYDGFVDFRDINPFVLALTDPVLYQQTYGGVCPRNRDINGDGIFNFADINPFVMLLSGG